MYIPSDFLYFLGLGKILSAEPKRICYRNIPHVSDNILEKRVLREVFGNKIWLQQDGGSVPLISVSSCFGESEETELLCSR